jgi:hypothetical protein
MINGLLGFATVVVADTGQDDECGEGAGGGRGEDEAGGGSECHGEHGLARLRRVSATRSAVGEA